MYEYKDAEYPSGIEELEENTRVHSQDLAKLIDPTIKAVDKLLKSLHTEKEKLATGEGIVFSKVKEIVNLEQEIVTIANKFASLIKEIE